MIEPDLALGELEVLLDGSPRSASATSESWRSLRRWMFAHLPAGFANAQLRRHVAVLLSLPLEEYTRARMTYDLGRLTGHGLIERIAKSHRYRLTPEGLRRCAFLTKLADRVLDPGLARCGLPADPGLPWQAFDRSLGVLLRVINLAA